MKARPQWPTFDPEVGGIRAFSQCFERMAKVIDYPESVYVATYTNLLKGIYQKKASMYLTLNEHATYPELRDHLINDMDRIQNTTSELRFNERIRKPGESYSDYAAQLVLLAWAAFGNVEGCSSQMIDRLTLACFLRNLQGDVGMKVREKFPKTLEDAVCQAQNFAITTAEEAAKVNAVNAIRGASRDRGAPRGGNRGNAANAVSGGQKDDKDLVCYNCQKKGHRKADCWSEGGGAHGQGSRQTNNQSASNRGGRGGFRGRGRGGNRGGRGGSRNNAVHQVNESNPEGNEEEE